MRPQDIVSKQKRSEMMRRVGQRGTPLERAVAGIIRGLGRRYRFNNRNLPGSPDLSNQREGWAIFVNGCFWHGHKNCPKTGAAATPRVPARHRRFWLDKIRANRARDARKCCELRRRGLKVIIVWECRLKDRARVAERLREVLG